MLRCGERRIAGENSERNDFQSWKIKGAEKSIPKELRIGLLGFF